MKRIGLLTFHNTTNFGSLLQTLALYEMINRLNCKCIVIDYKCEAIEKRELPLKPSKSKNIKKIIKTNVEWQIKKKKYKAFKKTIQEKLLLTKPVNKKNIDELNNEFDLFVSGSDILWDLELTNQDTTYFLDFVNDDNKKIAFATSVGSNWKEEIENIAMPLAQKFKHIALREKNSAEYLAERLDRKVDYVCDPTMLLSKDYWERLTDVDKKVVFAKKRYILIYFPNDEIIEDAIRYGEESKTEVWVINYGFPYKKVKNIRPYKIEEFLALIAEADMIFTSSYHGMLFSIYFNKSFYIYLRQNEHNIRFLSLLNMLGLEDRIKTDMTNMKLISDEKYDKVNSLIELFRQESIDVLREELK